MTTKKTSSSWSRRKTYEPQHRLSLPRFSTALSPSSRVRHLSLPTHFLRPSCDLSFSIVGQKTRSLIYRSRKVARPTSLRDIPLEIISSKFAWCSLSGTNLIDSLCYSSRSPALLSMTKQRRSVRCFQSWHHSLNSFFASSSASILTKCRKVEALVVQIHLAVLCKSWPTSCWPSNHVAFWPV